jgi:hypothetical protein
MKFDHYHYHWEGTPEEFAAASPTLKELMKTEPDTPASSPESEPELKGEAAAPSPATLPRDVTGEEALQILSRLELSPDIKKVLGNLYHATDPVSSEDLKKSAGLNGDQFRGVMGGFGRRVKHSAGKENVAFFIKEWRQDQYFWSLPECVKTAMEGLNLI